MITLFGIWLLKYGYNWGPCLVNQLIKINTTLIQSTPNNLTLEGNWNRLELLRVWVLWRMSGKKVWVSMRCKLVRVQVIGRRQYIYAQKIVNFSRNGAQKSIMKIFRHGKCIPSACESVYCEIFVPCRETVRLP